MPFGWSADVPADAWFAHREAWQHLIQETAYQSLLISRRQQLHQRIAENPVAPVPRDGRDATRVALRVPSTYSSNQLQPPAASIHDAAHRRVALRRSFHVVAASTTRRGSARGCRSASA